MGLAALALSPSLVACGTPGVPDPNPDPDPEPNGICIEDRTAAGYARGIGLDLDVSHFDMNDTEAVDGCEFTPGEREMLDVYEIIQTEDLISEETGATLDDFNEYITVAGPATARAVLHTYEMWKDNRQYEDVEFTPQKIGVFSNPLGDLRAPGTFHASGDFGPLTNYPMDDRVVFFAPLDWSNETEDVTSTFLSELVGYDACDRAQDQRFTSYDMSLNQEFDPETGTYEELWYEVENLFFAEATVEKILFRNEQSPVPHTSIDVALEWTVHPHDKHLMPAGTTIRAGYNHLTLEKTPTFYTNEDELPPGLREGMVLEPGESFAYLDTFRAGLLLDLSLTAPASDFPDIGPSLGDRIQLDPAAANYYPDGFEPRFDDQRLSDNRMYGPCRDDSGELVPVPDEAYTPPVSTTGDEFVYRVVP